MRTCVTVLLAATICLGTTTAEAQLKLPFKTFAIAGEVLNGQIENGTASFGLFTVGGTWWSEQDARPLFQFGPTSYFEIPLGPTWSMAFAFRKVAVGGGLFPPTEVDETDIILVWVDQNGTHLAALLIWEYATGSAPAEVVGRLGGEYIY